jgi:outer membrane protein TolC
MKNKLFIFIALTFFLLISKNAYSITLEEAVKRAMDVSYPIKEQKETVKRTEFSYISSIDPFLPTVTIQSGYNRYLYGAPITYTSGFAPLVKDEFYNASGTISYRLFDGGLRFAQREGSFSLMGREKEKLQSIKNDVLYNVRVAFFTALGKRTVVEKRNEAYETTKKLYDLTRGRFAEGIVRKSDVLQSEVRLTSSKIEAVDALTDYEKSMEDLKSLLLIDPDEKHDVEGALEAPEFRESYQSLTEKAIKTRPDVTYQLKEIDRLTSVYKEKKSNWWPKLDVGLQQSRQDGTFFPNNREDTLMLNFSYPLFDGVGRYYNMEGAQKDVNAAKYKLEEIKRNVKLDIIKAYKDFDLSLQNIRMYDELLREATTNFNQAIGEYKAGKGDILTLIQAEKDWAKAKENLAVSLYKSNNALAYLRKVSYSDGN